MRRENKFHDVNYNLIRKLIARVIADLGEVYRVKVAPVKSRKVVNADDALNVTI